MFGYSETVQVVKRLDVRESRIDKESCRAVATTHGNGLKRQRLNLLGDFYFFAYLIQSDILGHYAVNVGYHTVARMGVQICVALPLVIDKGAVNAKHNTLFFGGVPRKIYRTVRIEPTYRCERQEIFFEPFFGRRKINGSVAKQYEK